MNPELWQRLKPLFHQAADLEGPERAEFLDHHCQDASDLRRQLEVLLDHDQADIPILDGHLTEAVHAAFEEQPDFESLGFGEMLFADLANTISDAEPPTKRLGPYRLLREIGRGGMAIVYSAVRDDEQYRQQVAIKWIRRGMDSESIRARFRQERQILANLDHPNIARLFDGGVTEDGLPYLVMEQIDGEPIDRYCSERSLSVEARLRLFLTVCQAVRYAHQNLVVHRDLKPSNLLVTADGIPKLLDFGIAKLLEPTADDPFLAATAAGQRPMTPKYASPEQVMGLPVNTTSDVYSLGVLLYRLLTGRGPYQLPTGASRQNIETAIREQEPTPPSGVLSKIQTTSESSTVGEHLRWQRQLRGDLDNIVLKALRKHPEERYGSAEELAEDIRRHLAGLPIRARSATLAYRTGKFILRHRLAVVAVSLIVLSLLGGIITTSWQARRASEERLVGQRVSEFMIDLFEVTHPGEGLGAQITASELLKRASRQITSELEDSPKIRATLLDAMGLAFFKLGLWEDAEPLLERALALRRENDPRGADLSISLEHVGNLRRDQARYDEAEILHREALQRRRARFGAESAEVAWSETSVGITLFYQGDIEQAETLTRRALARQRRVLTEENRGPMATTLNNLALIIKSRGLLNEAIPLYREALTITRQTDGETHPDVAIHLVNLAETLREQGALQEAKGYYEQALALEREVLGDRHPALVDTLNNLASCLLDLGQREEAEILIDQSLKLAREVLGPYAPAIARGASLRARLAFERRDHDTAEAFYREALDIERRIHEGDHQEIVVSMSNLAAVLAGKGEDAEAEKAYREVLEIRRLAGDDRRAEIETLGRIARLQLRQGEDEAGRELYREALAVLKASPEVPAWTGAPLYRLLASSLLDNGYADQAEPYVRQALRLFTEHFGPKHKEVAITRTQLGKTLIALGRASEAESQFRASLTIWESLGKRGRRGRAMTQSALGACLIELGQLDEANRLLTSSIETLGSVLGMEHPRTLEALKHQKAVTEAPLKPDTP